MDDFRTIQVSLDPEGRTTIINPTGFPGISKGRHGALFNLLDGRCVKIFSKEEYALIEGNSYIKAEGSVIMPKLYEIGRNYIVIEYVDGLDMREYIRNNGSISSRLAENIVSMFIEMRRLGFWRMDESLRHIIVKQDESIKIVDHFYAYSLKDEKPIKFFRQLSELEVLNEFLTKTNSINNELYKEWSAMMPEYFLKSNSR